MGVIRKPRAGDQTSNGDMQITSKNENTAFAPSIQEVTLLNELFAATQNKCLKSLNEIGVSNRILYDFEIGIAGYFCFCPIEVSGKFYAPSETGVEAFIMPANRYEDGAIDDLVSFNLETPNRWWLRRGHARFLNQNAVDRAVACDEPLVLHATPLNWLKAECEGAVLLDWDGPLEPLPNRLLLANDVLAQRIKSITEAKRFPEIRVTGGRYAA